MSEAIERSLELFGKGYSCSQSVLAGFGPRFGLEEEMALRLVRSMGGGMGQGMPCGAVIGAYMVFCLSEEDPHLPKPERVEKVDKKIMDFRRNFSQRHGSVLCHQLLGIDPWSPEGSAKARDENLFKTVCPAFVRAAGELLEEMLEK